MTIGAHRKVVTVLFCDVVGSTALGESVDPEALQELLARYFERMKGIVESHRGSVEKFIGDAVMAVFGVPVAHEDDALRACRAALEMRDALPELGVEGRIGVNTGEVLSGTEERLATGDAVNIAARLEQAAEPGEVLIGSETLGLVQATVDVGDERLLELKGKSKPVAAHPLMAVLDVPERSHASRFVGREQELQQIVDSLDRALAGLRCELITIVGDPGVGKSRLVAEALAGIDARIVRGRCLSYGEGITYWPVVEVVKQLGALPSDHAAASAIRSLLGESDEAANTDEIAWAFRKLLEEQAPLVVCLDDIQWAEETFLDLVESTALLSTGAPLLLVCMARPELLDRRSGWPSTLRLEPLPEEEAGALVGDAVPEALRQRIVRAAGGNPLFLTEMVALTDEGDGEVAVPPTLRALLAARLDQLDESERSVLERGAVEGELFHRGAVQALASEETEVTPRLAALVRRQLVRPDLPQLPREEAYRFRHLLIRDAAYDALPKATRADLHRRFAAWLGEHGQPLAELDEILGYHLEQAARYLDELGRPDPQVALAGGDRLLAAGRRMLWRGDSRSAFALLERGLTLTRPHRVDVHHELDLASAISLQPRTAAAIATAAGDQATAAGDESAALLAQAAGASYRLLLGEASAAEVERPARAALPRLEAASDHYGLITVWRTLGDVANFGGRSEDRAKAGEEVIRNSRLAGEPPVHLSELAAALVNGPRPSGAALQALNEFVAEQPDPGFTMQRALLMAMLGRVDEARALAEPAQERMRDFGYGEEANLGLAEIAVLAGDEELAATHYRSYCNLLEARGRQAELSTYAPRLGQLLCNLGRHEEADVLAEQGHVLGDPDDIATQVGWRLTKALVCSARGQHAEAERLAREAVRDAETTDGLQLQAAALSDLGEVLEAAGRRNESIVAWQEALDRYQRKQIIPLVRRLRHRLSALKETSG